MKKLLKILLTLLIVAAVAVGGYIAYMQFQYYRIEDRTVLLSDIVSEEKIACNTPYRAMTFNVGYGAYSHAFSFFMDRSVVKATGEELRGKYGKGISREDVLRNSEQSVEFAKEAACDFYLLQEVDTDSTRSYGINQAKLFQEGFPSYESYFANNFHSAYLAYPLHDMHGAVNSGIQTLSRYGIASSVRRSFPVTDAFFDKFFDLDRCFNVNRMPLEDGKEFVLINVHLSAYDKGGLIRKEQLKMLNGVLVEEREKGNYILVGGDFNHDYCNSREKFLGDKEVPAWLQVLSEADLAEGYSFVIPKNVDECGTCRGTETPYDPALTSQFTVDGFLVSDNIRATAEIIDTRYVSSDHNPVLLSFTLVK